MATITTTATIDLNDVFENITDDQIIAECAEREIMVSSIDLDFDSWVQRLRDAARTDIATAPGVPLEQISSLHKAVADFIAEATGQIL